MSEKNYYKTVKIIVGNPPKEAEGVFGGKQTSYNPHYCNTSLLSEKIEEEGNKLFKEGYKIISITPIIKGISGYEMGFSVTEGVIITAESFQI